MNSARSSFSSLPGRRTSITSVLSSAERRTSFQSGRRASDSSVESFDKPNRGKLLSANNSLLIRSEVMFSTIQEEHTEESQDSEIPQQNALNLSLNLDPTIDIMILSEEPKVIIRTHNVKCTEV